MMKKSCGSTLEKDNKKKSPKSKLWYIIPLVIGLSSIVLFYVTTSAFEQSDEDIIVNTVYGKLKGFSDISREGRKFYGFQGIPYASPPIGDLRFEVSILQSFTHYLYQLRNEYGHCSQ